MAELLKTKEEEPWTAPLYKGRVETRHRVVRNKRLQ